MAIALTLIGLILIITGYQGTYGALFKQLKTDFTGSGNFFYWIAAIIIIGSVGYIPKMQKFSIAFLTLIIIAMILNRQGVFANLVSSLDDITGTLTGPTSFVTPESGSSSNSNSGEMGAIGGEISDFSSIGGE